MPRARLKVAVIGAGNMGRHHIRNYKEMDGCQLIAIADMDERGRTRAEEFGAKYYANYQDLIDVQKPDAISVVVPTAFHYDVARYALERGVHVLVEKPIAATVREARELTRLANRQKLVFTVGHIERFNPAILHLYKLMQSGRLGDISSLVSRRVGGFPQREPSTDVIVDLAIHDIDIIASLLGQRPKLLAAHGSRTFHQNEVDSAELLLGFDEASGFIQTNWVTPVKVRTISVTGSKGYVEANYITQEVLLYEHTAVRAKDNFSDFIRDLGTPKVHRESVAVKEPLRLELELFLEAVGTGDTSSLVKPGDAIIALEVALKASHVVTRKGRL